ncbi:putative capsid protein [Aiptasia sp. sea anemone associated circular virus]|uniref:Putative capsid protein n=1 Tax=Aiptasia sp. sea anemone associated circular virus TaxID=1692242 RepID=A0A0K1RKZ2_9VIRU|nr:putative capsid protein [Aiptasia sp. sea anemone associated circular virus]AKV62255.1 putative capsid protein [Aiptasia sp. sea anemone associated circular virus]AKV62257.1 putative capsid protein [Aiptasia sp. sea anemone associated circular virus]
MPYGPIVAYGAKRALIGAAMSTRAYKRARTAYRVGSYARAYGPTAIRAGRRIWKAYRRYRGKNREQFSRTNIGERVGSSSTKKRYAFTILNATQGDTRTLTTHLINNIPEKSALNQNNNRRRQIVNLRGVKLCLEFRNQLARPLYLNVAVLGQKTQNQDLPPSVLGFFRGFDQNSRSEDFTTARSANELHCLPINPDKFTVLRHKRYRLIPNSDAGTVYNDHSGHSYMNMDWWLKVKRQIRYTDGGDIDSGSLWLCHWCDEIFAGTFAPVQPDAYAYTIRSICYFKEPKT